MTRSASLFARTAFQVLLVAAGSLASVCAQAAPPAKPAPVLISALHGDVRIASKGALTRVSTGMTLNLPATIRTGANGAIELRQGDTIVSAAANAELDIPLSADPKETLDRIIQSRGNVYYSVAKRSSSKLHVETRYLVAVIKGTQFNVSVTDTGSTISLLEGMIELRSPDGSDVIDLAAGQIGTISSLQPRIRVLQMATGDNVRAGLPALPARDGAGVITATAGTAQTGSGAKTEVVRPVNTDATAVIASGTGTVRAVKDVTADTATAAVVTTVSTARVLVSNTVPVAQERDSSVLALETLVSRVSVRNTGTGGTGTGSGSGTDPVDPVDPDTDTSDATVPKLVRDLEDLADRIIPIGSSPVGTQSP